MEKLRKEFIKERKAMIDIMKNVVTERQKRSVVAPVPAVVAPKKMMTIDPQKLEDTIKKACVPITRKSILVLEKPPMTTTTATQKVVVTSSLLCQARNLNGTPCKCKAKLGKFCAKHAP